MVSIPPTKNPRSIATPSGVEVETDASDVEEGNEGVELDELDNLIGAGNDKSDGVSSPTASSGAKNPVLWWTVFTAVVLVILVALIVFAVHAVRPEQVPPPAFVQACLSDAVAAPLPNGSRTQQGSNFTPNRALLAAILRLMHVTYESAE